MEKLRIFFSAQIGFFCFPCVWRNMEKEGRHFVLFEKNCRHLKTFPGKAMQWGLIQIILFSGLHINALLCNKIFLLHAK